MKAKDIYEIFRSGGLSRAGALGMLGNLQAESGLKENIVQRGMQSLSDEEYTRQVDAGVRSFEDSVGYGLAQFTYFSRKRALLRYAKYCGTSVGDGVMQCNFILLELKQDFPGLFNLLCESDDINLCADRVCDTYERPAVNNYAQRRQFALRFAEEIPEEDNALERALALLDELRDILKGVL